MPTTNHNRQQENGRNRQASTEATASTATATTTTTTNTHETRQSTKRLTTTVYFEKTEKSFEGGLESFSGTPPLGVAGRVYAGGNASERASTTQHANGNDDDRTNPILRSIGGSGLAMRTRTPGIRRVGQGLTTMRARG